MDLKIKDVAELLFVEHEIKDNDIIMQRSQIFHLLEDDISITTEKIEDIN